MSNLQTFSLATPVMALIQTLYVVGRKVIESITVSLKHISHKSKYYESQFTNRGLEKCCHHCRRRRRLHHHRGSIHWSCLRSRVNASGRPYLPTTTRQHLGGISVPSRNRRAGAEYGGERSNEHQQQQQYAYRRCRADGRTDARAC